MDVLQVVVVVVVVVGLLPHVDGDAVVELLLMKEVLQLPVGVEVCVQVLVVVEEVVRVLLPERGPVASHEPQVASELDLHKKGSISGQDAAVAQMKSKVLMMSMGLKPKTSFSLLPLWNTKKTSNFVCKRVPKMC